MEEREKQLYKLLHIVRANESIAIQVQMALEGISPDVVEFATKELLYWDYKRSRWNLKVEADIILAKLQRKYPDYDPES